MSAGARFSGAGGTVAGPERREGGSGLQPEDEATLGV